MCERARARAKIREEGKKNKSDKKPLRIDGFAIKDQARRMEVRKHGL